MVSGSGKEDEHHLSYSTPARCQSHTGSKRPFIPEPCTIDLFIPASSFYLTISASHSFSPGALLSALLFFFFFKMSNTPPDTHSYSHCALSRSRCLKLAVPGKSTSSLSVFTHTHTHTSDRHTLLLYPLSHESCAVIISPQAWHPPTQKLTIVSRLIDVLHWVFLGFFVIRRHTHLCTHTIPMQGHTVCQSDECMK